LRMFDYDDLDETLSSGDIPDKSADSWVRIWAISDVHTDMKQNMKWLQGLDVNEYERDVLILAGDVSDKFDNMGEALRVCRRCFSRVFFVPGNHDLWVTESRRRESVADEEKLDSIRKLRRLLQLCEQLGIETAPGEVCVGAMRVLVVPILAFHHPQWDTEPEIQEWDGIDSVDHVVSDYMLTSWPPGVEIQDGSAAHAIDAINDEIFHGAELLERRTHCDAVISFSHFLPRVELNPEKRYLAKPQLAKAVGSNYLRQRVEEVRPDVHVFGHTHFGYDMVVDGVRYIQAALAYPVERTMRPTSVAVDDLWKPCLVWDSLSGWAPKHRGAWSEYYMRYGRCPEVTSVLPSYVADSLRPVSDICRVGWVAGRMPAWLFGPREHRLFETRRAVEHIRNLFYSARAGNQTVSQQPKVVTAPELAVLLSRNHCTIVDVRADALRPRNGKRFRGSVAVPHPALTETFPTLPENELLELCERVLASEGPLVLVGAEAASSEYAAVLLASFLRLRPRDILILDGGIEAWIRSGGDVE